MNIVNDWVWWIIFDFRELLTSLHGIKNYKCFVSRGHGSENLRNEERISSCKEEK